MIERTMDKGRCLNKIIEGKNGTYNIEKPEKNLIEDLQK